MPGALHDYLSRDHERLDALLARALRSDGSVDLEPWGEFRRGLLRHIGIEEKILFPEIRRRRGESDVERQLHRDHAALAALLVPPPEEAEVRLVREILEEHNPIEERGGGMYDVFESLAGEDLDALMARVRGYPAVPLAPYSDSDILRRSIERLLRDRKA